MASRATAKQLDSLSHLYVTLLKKVMILERLEHLHHIRDDDFLAFVCEPTLAMLINYRIATFIPKIMARFALRRMPKFECHYRARQPWQVGVGCLDASVTAVAYGQH
eukprot:2183557-Amphidinium_carterae.1